MLVELVVSGLVGIAALVTNQLPACTGGVGPGCLSVPDLTGWAFWYSWLDSFLPLHEGIDLLVLTLQVLTVLAGLWVLIWIARRLPFNIGGS